MFDLIELKALEALKGIKFNETLSKINKKRDADVNFAVNTANESQ